MASGEFGPGLKCNHRELADKHRFTANGRFLAMQAPAESVERPLVVGDRRLDAGTALPVNSNAAFLLPSHFDGSE